MTGWGRGLTLGTLLATGWLAQALASTDRDVDRGIEALEAGDHELALKHFEAAEARRGERAEIAYDRGLALRALGRDEDAAKAFERGTESEDPGVRASSHYELGNAAFEDESYDAAIEAYAACLRAAPEHENAKWNLELALRRKQEQEQDEQEQDEQEQDEQEKDEQEQDEQEKDEQEQDETEQDEQEQDEQEQDAQEQDEQEQDEQEQDEQEQDEQGQDEPGQDEQGQDEQGQDEQGQDEQERDEQEQDEQPKAQPRELDEADLDKALEQLDEEDRFMLGRPNAPRRPVEKDW